MTTTLADLQRSALEVAKLYDEVNRRKRGRVWTREETMLGFVGDVSDLAKLVLAAEGVGSGVGGLEALEHELADCLWAVLILAAHYDVDLEAVFTQTMGDLSRYLLDS